MLRSTFFVQDCPTCGRRVEVRVEYLGKVVVCDHCQGSFEASDPNGASQGVDDRGLDLLLRAQRLLDTVEAQRARANYAG